MKTRSTKKDFRIKEVRLCFTLPATLGDRGQQPYERLNSPEDLVRWLNALGFSDVSSGIDEKDLLATKKLREAIQRAAEMLAVGDAIKTTDLKAINTYAKTTPPIPQLSNSGHDVVWQATDLYSVLSMISRDFINLASGPLAAYVKICANVDCVGVFVDESRPKNRRWCSMQTCGNQMKKIRMQICAK
jgi:predicted RNA-binding Zn ribbon-like protein